MSGHFLLLALSEHPDRAAPTHKKQVLRAGRLIPLTGFLQIVSCRSSSALAPDVARPFPALPPTPTHYAHVRSFDRVFFVVFSTFHRVYI